MLFNLPTDIKRISMLINNSMVMRVIIKLYEYIVRFNINELWKILIYL